MVMLYITRSEVAMALNCAKNILRYLLFLTSFRHVDDAKCEITRLKKKKARK